MTIRCKFLCDRVSKTQGDAEIPFLFSAHFFAVHDGSPENKEFFRWTPSGTLELSTYRKDVFEVGKEYFIDLSLAEPVKA